MSVLQSMASVIGEQCKQLMGGSVKDLTQRDKDVLSALLFLARQIYTTHEGLAVMARVNIVALANDVLSVSGRYLNIVALANDVLSVSGRYNIVALANDVLSVSGRYLHIVALANDVLSVSGRYLNIVALANDVLSVSGRYLDIVALANDVLSVSGRYQGDLLLIIQNSVRNSKNSKYHNKSITNR